MRQGLGTIVGLLGLATLVAACGGSGGGQSGGGGQSLDQRVEKLCAVRTTSGARHIIEDAALTRRRSSPFATSAVSSAGCCSSITP